MKMIVDDVHDERPTFACALFCFRSLDQRILFQSTMLGGSVTVSKSSPIFLQSAERGLDSDPHSQGRGYPIGCLRTSSEVPSLIALRLLGVFGRGSFNRDALDLAHCKYRLSRLLQERAVSMASPLPHLWLEMMSKEMKEVLE